MTTVTLRGAGRRYTDAHNAVDALGGVDLVVQQGEFVAVQGPSGGGKSTLLNVLGLLDVPSYGDHLIDGMSTVAQSEQQRAETRSSRFAYVFQGFHLLERRPVIHSVELALLYRGVAATERRLASLNALAEVGLATKADQVASTLSGGEQQRVAIARALTSGADIIVADEPTGNLDSANSELVMASLEALNAAGRTVIVVTHSSGIANAAPRTIRLRDGKIVEDTGSRTRALQSAMPGGRPQEGGVASRVRAADYVRDAGASLRARFSRTFGLVIAVAVGIGLAVATAGLSTSSTAQVRDTFDAHVNRDVTVSWSPSDDVDAAGLPRRLSQLRGVAAAGLIRDRGRVSVQANGARDVLDVPAYTIAGEAMVAARSEVTWARGHPKSLLRGEVLIGRSLAAQLAIPEPSMGESYVAVNGAIHQVAGQINKAPRDPRMLGGLAAREAAEQAFEQTNSISALILTSAGAASQVARQAPLVINPRAPDSLQVEAPPDPRTLRAEIEADVEASLLAFTGLAVLASIAALANAMAQSVLERRREIGLRRAVGARGRHIAGLIVVESTTVGCLGGAIGLVLGLGGVLAVTLVRHWVPIFDLRLAPAAVIAGVVVGAMGGVVAARRASRVQPHEALQQ